MSTPNQQICAQLCRGVSWARAEHDVPEVADGLVELGDGVADVLARPVPVHQSQRGLKGQPRREQAVGHNVVDVAGDAVVIVY